MSVPSKSRVVATKLRPPALPNGVVDRPKLIETLDASGERVVLISAPAGFGKTVLVLEWLRKCSGPLAWLSLDPLDNDPVRFSEHLATALRSLDPSSEGPTPATLRSAGVESQAGTVEARSALAGLPADSMIVLDDLHVLDDRSVLDSLSTLLHDRDGPRWLLLSRVDPGLPLGRLRVEGDLLELRERMLRFSLEEATELFDRLLPEGLSRSLVERLVDRTEGWAAGLRMAAIALGQAEDPAGVVEGFGGSHRFVVDYLLEEAVRRQSESVQQFLMETAVLPRFTREACAAVTGDPGAADLLQKVEEANLFLFALGEDRTWFRYHHLFAELLRFRLKRLDPDRLPLLNERASRWFEEQGDVHEAMEHAARLDDPTRLLDLLDRHGLAVVARSELGSLARWLDRIRDPLEHPYPVFLTTLGWFHLLRDRAPDLERILAAASAALDQLPESYAAERRRRARIELDILRAFDARFAGRLDEAVEISREALRTVPAEDALSRGRLLYNQARVHAMLGEMDAATELLEPAFDDNLRAGNYYLVLSGLAQTGAILLQTDGVQRARESLESARTFARDHELDTLPAYASVLHQLGLTLWIADDLAEAEAHLRQAISVSGAGGLPEGRANALVQLTRVQAARGDYEAARSSLNEAAALAHRHNVMLRDTIIEIERNRLALLEEQHGAGPAAPRVEPPADGTRWSTVAEARCLLALTQAVHRDDRERAAMLADRITRQSSPAERGVAHSVALLVTALTGDSDARWETLEGALSLAGARGYARPLLDLGEPAARLVRAGLERSLSGPARAWGRTLLERMASSPAEESPPPAELVDPLTDREQDVLRHLSRGLSNRAIARSLFVSGETVKTHLKHVYAKLGVSNRSDAVARARELGLLAADESARA